MNWNTYVFTGMHLHIHRKRINWWCNSYHRWEWTRQLESKSWPGLFAFDIVLISLEHISIGLFSLQLRVNSWASWGLSASHGNRFKIAKTCGIKNHVAVKTCFTLLKHLAFKNKCHLKKKHVVLKASLVSHTACLICFGLVLWHINEYWLLNSKSCFYIDIRYMICKPLFTLCITQCTWFGFMAYQRILVS